MHHLAVYRTTALDATINFDVPAAPDGILTINPANHFILPMRMTVWVAAAMAITLARARIMSPRIRQIAPAYIRPISAALLPPNDPNVAWYGDSGLLLEREEEVSIEATDSAAGPNEFHAGLWLMPQPYVPEPSGDPIRIRYTSTVTVGVGVWSLIQPIFETSLALGEYALVGLENISANCLFARAILDNQFWRPGSLGLNADANRTAREFYQHDLGDWGHFRSVSMPRIEVFCDAADASHEGFMEVIRVGN